MMEGIPPKENDKPRKTEQLLRNIKNIGLAAITPILLSQNVNAQDQGYQQKSIKEVVVTTPKANYQKQLDAYNQSQVVLNKWRSTNLLSEEQSKLQNGRIVSPPMVTVSNDEVPAIYRVQDDDLIPLNYIKVTYSTESESQIEYVPNYNKPEPPPTKTKEEFNNVKNNHKHLDQKSPEVLYTADELPPAYSRKAVSDLDSIELAIYNELYKQNQDKIKKGIFLARTEPFNIEDFPFWKEFDQSLWPKYVAYLAPQVDLKNPGGNGISEVQFFLPPLPSYENNKSENNRNTLHKPSQNFPRLTEIYLKNSDGSLKFDHYEDEKTKENFGTDFTNPQHADK